MPKLLDRLVFQLTSNGMDKDRAYATAVASLQRSGNLKSNSTEPTAKGIRRGEMTPAERARDRAAKRSGGNPMDYKYNPMNNTAVKGKINTKVKRRK